MEQEELYKALVVAHQDALEQVQRHLFLSKEAALYGWSQEKHVKYHEDVAMQAVSVVHFLYRRMMQINPD